MVLAADSHVLPASQAYAPQTHSAAHVMEAQGRGASSAVCCLLPPPSMAPQGGSRGALMGVRGGSRLCLRARNPGPTWSSSGSCVP